MDKDNFNRQKLGEQYNQWLVANNRKDGNYSNTVFDFWESLQSLPISNVDLILIRNKLVDVLPTGDVHAFDIIKAIQQYLIWFDEYTSKYNENKNSNVDEAAEKHAIINFPNKSSWEFHTQYISFKAGAEWYASQTKQ